MAEVARGGRDFMEMAAHTTCIFRWFPLASSLPALLHIYLWFETDAQTHS